MSSTPTPRASHRVLHILGGSLFGGATKMVIATCGDLAAEGYEVHALASDATTAMRFEDAGIIERHDFREGRARYEQMRDSHHDHLINLRDGKVIEFTSEEIEKLQAEIARKLGYKLVDHRLELYCVPLDDDKS